MRYRLLGHVTASDGPLGGAKPRSVLAALLLHANQVVPDRRLWSLVWGDSPPATVRSQLQICVSGLRKLLGPATILRSGTGYLIRVLPGELDLDVFTDLVAHGRFRDALDLWQGPALSGCTDSLVDSVRLDDRRLAAFEAFFDTELQRAPSATLIAELRRLVAEHPHRERFAEQLMLALHAAGRTAEALAAYTTTRRRLIAELGIEPDTRLQDLHQHLITGRTQRPQPDTAAGRPTPAQLPQPSRSPAHRPTPPLIPTPAQLPHSPEGFAGRVDELRRLDADLADWAGDSVRIRVLAGPPGVGKTALAVRWAQEVRAEFPDGQLYVDLSHADPDTALKGLLHALGVDRVPDRTEERAALYRSALAERKVLVLLDNAADADQVRPLLPGRSALVLVTSRRRLTGLAARDGARVMRLHAGVWGGREGVERQPERGHVAQIGVVLPHRGQLRRRQGLAEDPELVEGTV
ncbi:transcriptional regulator [Kutzneria sp. 744]|uniref:AfsR/SARP family transcriptional regulator n=1 Tax=Kutzneria sp. (strain 744) TaxID=345341 RepID=UPI0003EED9F2|nr:transcriptional regulator [Kutzneria sp. 744]EWM10799.1 regulatory protein AfsR [Kutzneria sp. 744]